MALFVETSEEDSWLAVVTYIGELIDGEQDAGSKLVETPGSRFMDDCKKAYAAERYADLLESFIAKLDLLYSKAQSDQDLEGTVNIICHLVPRVSAHGPSPAASQLAAALASQPSLRPDRRLQALVNLYNVVIDPSAKLQVLLQALAFSKASGLADIMLGVVRTNADTWARDLGLSSEDERALYVACADALRTCTRKPKTAAKEAYRLLTKHVATYEGASAGDAAKAAPVAARVVCEFLRSPDMYTFDLAANPAVAALASDKQHAAVYKLLQVYLRGSVADFKALSSAEPGVFATVGTTQEEALDKMRLLALMGLAHGAGELAFSKVSSSLELGPGEVESVVVQAIGKRLIEARIDQLREVVLVSKCAPRTFGEEQWRELQVQLKGWKESVAHVQTLGTDEKTVLPAGIQALSMTA